MSARATILLQSMAPDRIGADEGDDVWSDARNVLFRNGESVRVPGDSDSLVTSETPRTLAYTETAAGVKYWVYATASGIFVHDGATESDVTPVGGWSPGPTAVYTSCVLNGIPFINTSDQDPVYWDGNPANPCEPLPNWPSGGRCLALRKHKNFLFALGFISEARERIRWSDAAAAGQVPGTWDPQPDNLAGFLDLAPQASPVRDGETLRDSFLVYKGESIWALDFIGGEFVFNARVLFSEHGIQAPNAITRGIDDVHLFAGAEGDVFITDGVQVRSVLDGKAQRLYYAAVRSNPDGIFSAATLSRDKVGLIMFPDTGAASGQQALIYDYTSGSIGFRDLPDVLCAGSGQDLTAIDAADWDSDPQEWQLATRRWNEEPQASTLDDVLIGGPFGIRKISDPNAQDFAGLPIQSYLAKNGVSFGRASVRKLIRRIWPKVEGAPGSVLRFRVGGADTATGPVTFAPSVDYVIGQDRHIDTFVSGRFLHIQVESNGGPPWRLGSFDVDFREQGAF